MPTPACRAAHGRSCRPRPWSRRARIWCRSASCRNPCPRMHRALAGVDQVHDGEAFGQRTDRRRALDRGDMHVTITLVAFARILGYGAVDGEASTGDVGLDRLVLEIDADLAQPRAVQIVHMYLHRLRTLHFQQKIDVVVDLELPRAGSAAGRGDAAPRAAQPE